MLTFVGSSLEPSKNKIRGKSMHRRIPAFLLVTILLLAACGENPYRQHYEDDKMIGFILEILPDIKVIEVDISEWEKRGRRGSITSEGYSYKAEINEETEIRYEDGTEANINDVKKGQKIMVNPSRGDNFEGEPEEVILLDMTYEEKYSRLLSHLDDKLNVVVMYEEGQSFPSKMDERILKNIEQKPVGKWMPYPEDYVVDYKVELGIEKFPVILVFSSKELMFKAYGVEELYEFFESLN